MNQPLGVPKVRLPSAPRPIGMGMCQLFAHSRLLQRHPHRPPPPRPPPPPTWPYAHRFPPHSMLASLAPWCGSGKRIATISHRLVLFPFPAGEQLERTLLDSLAAFRIK